MIQPGCLLDTGPLVALLSRGDQDHERSKRLFGEIQPPLLTCEAVITEACYLIGKTDPEGPEEIFSLGEKGFYRIVIDLEDHRSAIHSLLKKYRDLPISLADACLIHCAELHKEPRILTFDSDFEIYRWGRNRRFVVLQG